MIKSAPTLLCAVPRRTLAALLLGAASAGLAQAAPIDWQGVGPFDIARTETTIAQFRAVVAATGT
jgi:formylglycine-generating enzyme required for sulfatase activity